jgi:hypothetical protein
VVLDNTDDIRVPTAFVVGPRAGAGARRRRARARQHACNLSFSTCRGEARQI